MSKLRVGDRVSTIVNALVEHVCTVDYFIPPLLALEGTYF